MQSTISLFDNTNNQLLIEYLTKEISDETKKINEIYNKMSEETKNEYYNDYLIRHYHFDYTSVNKKSIIFNEIIDRKNSCIFALIELLENAKKNK